MAQHIQFPDYRDRSLNHPAVLVNLRDFLELYYQQNPEAQTMSTSAEDEKLLKQWFTRAAIMVGWPAVGFMGLDALLSIVPLPTWVNENIDGDLNTLEKRLIEPLPEPGPSDSGADEVKDPAPAGDGKTKVTEPAEPVKQPDTTVPGKTATSGCTSKLHVSVAEVANYSPNISHDYKRG